MREGAKMLIGMRHDNVLLSCEAVERALCVAEAHMPRVEEGAAGATKAFKADVEEQEIKTTDERVQNPFAEFSPEELQLMCVFLSQMDGKSAGAGSPAGAGKKLNAD
eukprot:352489-Rhodomonas_salina.1